MKNLLAGLSLGVLLLSGTAAHADTIITTTGVRVEYVNGTVPGDWDITLAGEGSTGSAISLNTLTHDLSNHPAIDDTGTLVAAGNTHWSVLQVSVLPGWTVTGVRLGGAFFGDLVTAQAPGQPDGIASNSATLAWTVAGAGGLADLPSFSAANFTGQNIFDLPSGPYEFGDTFYLIFNGSIGNVAQGIAGADASIASVDAGQVILNIYAVPEPATYGMLLAGLGLVGVAAVKRRR